MLPLTGRDGDPHLGHAISDKLAVAEVAKLRTDQPRRDPRFRLVVGKPDKPIVEDRRSAEREHAELYSIGYV